MGEALVGGDEQIELAQRVRAIRRSLCFSNPSLRRVALMTGKQFAQRRRDAFVEQYLHAG